MHIYRSRAAYKFASGCSNLGIAALKEGVDGIQVT
jgi:hypothetical protein